MTLEELQQLNQEIAALSKAGIPLGPGLLQTASNRSVPRRLREIAKHVGQRLAQGEPLATALRDERVPRIYAAVVELGNASGNLPVALESMTEHFRRLVELRRLTITSMSYPIVLIVLTCLGFVFCLAPALRSISAFLETADMDATSLQGMIEWLVGITGWLRFVPLAAVGGASSWWYLSGRATQRGLAARWFGWVPGARRLLRAGSRSTLAHLLGILSRHEVPVERALTLAAEATGEPGIIAEGRELSLAFERGERSAIDRAAPTAIPGTIRWLLHSAPSPAALETGLARLSDMYQREVSAHEVWTKTFVPVLATILVGGTATALYSLAIIGPWVSSLWQLCQP